MQDLINTSSCVSELSCKMAEEAMNEALNALATLQEKVCSFCSQIQLNFFLKTCSTLGQDIASL